jgi:RES domain-containing protein
VIAYRIGSDTREYQSDDLSGAGAKSTGGRWNSPGNACVYAASSRALAALETLVHMPTDALPLNRYLVAIEIPPGVWAARAEWSSIALSVGWDAQPPGQVSVDLGDRWLLTRTSAILLVPSVVVPEEANVLINPAHPDAAHLRARKERRWLYDARLGRTPGPGHKSA